MNSRTGNIFIGILMTILSVYLYIEKASDNFQYMPLLFTSLAIMFFSLAYLHPQLQSKDERSKLIKEKSMFITYFFLFFYYLLFLSLIYFNVINIDAIDLLQILPALTLITVFIIMVILSIVF